MADEKRIELTSSCSFVETKWTDTHKDVCLEYTEHSIDPWYSDSETSIDIDADMAAKIVQFLINAFPQIKEATNG